VKKVDIVDFRCTVAVASRGFDSLNIIEEQERVDSLDTIEEQESVGWESVLIFFALLCCVKLGGVLGLSLE